MYRLIQHYETVHCVIQCYSCVLQGWKCFSEYAPHTFREVNVKFTLQQAMKAQRGSRDIRLVFL